MVYSSVYRLERWTLLFKKLVRQINKSLESFFYIFRIFLKLKLCCLNKNKLCMLRCYKTQQSSFFSLFLNHLLLILTRFMNQSFSHKIKSLFKSFNWLINMLQQWLWFNQLIHKILKYHALWINKYERVQVSFILRTTKVF